ncbi:MAG: hypothetical protein GY864_10975 [Desulfobacterales bacterium]|nr:hypothetical protein [Desulfobacterales bacterium]
MTQGTFDKSQTLFSLFFLYGLCLAAFFVTGCGLFDESENRVAIVLGSRQVTIDELREDMSFMNSGMGLLARHGDKIREKLIDRIIDHYLILEYGKERNIALSENELQQALQDIRSGYTEESFKNALLRECVDFQQWSERLGEQLLVNKIIREMVKDIDLPGYQEIKLYFEEHRDEFKTPGMIKFRQIVTRTKGEAEELLQRLKKGEKISELARENSIAPEAGNGGEVGWIAAGTLDESMEKALFSTPKGEFSPVVKTPYGYHIFEGPAVRSEGVREFSDVISEIEAKLLDRSRKTLCKRRLQELRARFKVDVNQELLDELEINQ